MDYDSGCGPASRGGDLLPFYVMMLALSPLMLELLRRRGGAAILGAISLALFYFGETHPWAFAIAAHDIFAPVLWQSIFIAGLIAGKLLPDYDALAKRWKLCIAAFCWTVFGLLFVSEFSSNFGLPGLNLGVGFVKVPLSAGEALRYLSMVIGIMATTDLAWGFIGFSRACEFVQTLGRKSLPVYVAHVWLVKGMAAFAIAYWWMGRWQMLMGIIAVGMLWAFAKLLEALKTPVPKRTPQPVWNMPAMAKSDAVAA